MYVLNDTATLTFTKVELERMLEYCEAHLDRNVVLVWDDNEVGTVYGVQLQDEVNDKGLTKVPFMDITDYEAW